MMQAESQSLREMMQAENHSLREAIQAGDSSVRRLMLALYLPIVAAVVGAAVKYLFFN